MAYKYVAYTSAGELAEGVLDVQTEEAAGQTLWRCDMIILA